MEIEDAHSSSVNETSISTSNGEESSDSEKCFSPSNEEKSMKIADFDVGRELGMGRFSSVYLGRLIKHDLVVAIKVLPREVIKEHGIDLQIIREMELQFHLRHRNILRLYTHFSDPKKLYLVLQYANGGNLRLLLDEHKILTVDKTAEVVDQLCAALQYCHDRKVIHRDVKPENVLFMAGDVVKLADFGCAVHAPNSRCLSVVGTLDYMSPEMLNEDENRSPYTHAVDNWAVGIIAFECLTTRLPFWAESRQETARNIRAAELTSVLVSQIPIDARPVVIGLLTPDPQKRMSLKQVRQSHWVGQIRRITFSPIAESPPKTPSPATAE